MKSRKIILTIVAVLICMSIFVIIINAADLSESGSSTGIPTGSYVNTTYNYDAVFVYDIKAEYDSYTGVKKEIGDLWDAFDDYREENFPGFSYDDNGNLTAESKELRKKIEAQRDKADNYEELLWRYAIKNFTDEEIDTAEKEEELHKKIATLSDNVIQCEEVYYMVSLSKKSDKKQSLARAKEKLEVAEKVVEDYENRLITLDEALEKLDVTYDESCRPKEMRAAQRKTDSEKLKEANGEISTAAN